MPEELKFFYGDKNNDFITKLKLLGLNCNMQKFSEFLTLHYCARILREDILTIHIETAFMILFLCNKTSKKNP